MRLALAIVASLATVARADELDDPPRPPRPFHGSLGVGGALLLTGNAGGSRLRVEGEVDVEPGGRFGRFGGLLAIRAADRTHHGLACAGLMFEAAASRPRLVLDLHADVGVDLDQRAPLIGAGIRTVVTIIGPLGVAIDAGAILVIDGLDRSRLAIGSATSIVARW